MRKSQKKQPIDNLGVNVQLILFSPVQNEVFLFDDGDDSYITKYMKYASEDDFILELIYFAEQRGFIVNDYYDVAVPKVEIHYSYVDDTPPSFNTIRHIVVTGDIVDKSKVNSNDDGGAYIKLDTNREVEIVNTSAFDDFLSLNTHDVRLSR